MLFIAPFLMSLAARTRRFATAPLFLLICTAIFTGAIIGVFVLARIIRIALNDDEARLAINWALAGASSGSITLVAIVLMYRRGKQAHRGQASTNVTADGHELQRDRPNGRDDLDAQ
jgi:uncharacterized membrane protein